MSEIRGPMTALAHAIVDRILERGRMLMLDGPSMRTKHLGLDDPTANGASTQSASLSEEGARISGIQRPEFPEPTTLTSASWLNQVERFFSEITTKRIRRGTFDNVRALEAAIEEYLTHHNTNPKPFVWTATADAIIDKVKRFCERTSETRH